MLIDKTIAPFTLLLGPLVLGLALVLGNWQLGLALVVWWHVSRAVKIWPHLRRQPRDWLILPVFIAVTYYMSLVKAYALVTINEHKWLDPRGGHGRWQGHPRERGRAIGPLPPVGCTQKQGSGGTALTKKPLPRCTSDYDCSIAKAHVRCKRRRRSGGATPREKSFHVALPTRVARYIGYI